MLASSAIFAINSALFIVCCFKILRQDKFRRFYIPTKFFYVIGQTLDTLQPACGKDFRGMHTCEPNGTEIQGGLEPALVLCFTGKGLESLPALHFKHVYIKIFIVIVNFFYYPQSAHTTCITVLN